MPFEFEGQAYIFRVIRGYETLVGSMMCPANWQKSDCKKIDNFSTILEFREMKRVGKLLAEMDQWSDTA